MHAMNHRRLTVAVNVVVWTVASDSGIQHPMTDDTFEALFVVHPAFREDLIGVIDVAVTFRTALTVRGLYSVGIGVLRPVLHSVPERKMEFCG